MQNNITGKVIVILNLQKRRMKNWLCNMEGGMPGYKHRFLGLHGEPMNDRFHLDVT
jgi:hypothetical protein